MNLRLNLEKKFITQSAIFHLAIVLFFTVKGFIFPSQDIKYIPSVRVDIIDLPKKNQKVSSPIKKSTKKEVTKKSQKKSKKIKKSIDKNLAIKKIQKQNKALERLKALQEIEEMEEEYRETPEPIKGNIIAPGTQLKGLNQIEYDSYISDLDTHLKNHWILPKWLEDDSLSTQVIVFINTQGYVIKKEIRKSSNNLAYDNAVIDAINRASPFPKPPNKFEKLVNVEGIVFGFPE